MRQMIFNPSPFFFNLRPLTPPFPPRLCPCFHLQFTATPGSCPSSLPVEFFIMYSFWFVSTAEPGWGKRETTSRASGSQKSVILIRSAQLLVQVYINTTHCIPGEDSITNSPDSAWLPPRQQWAEKWKIFEEEKKYFHPCSLCSDAAERYFFFGGIVHIVLSATKSNVSSLWNLSYWVEIMIFHQPMPNQDVFLAVAKGLNSPTFKSSLDFPVAWPRPKQMKAWRIRGWGSEGCLGSTEERERWGREREVWVVVVRQWGDEVCPNSLKGACFLYVREWTGKGN